MAAYTNLTDEIIHQILLNPDPRLEKARRLVNDLWRRKLYKCVHECPPILAGRLNMTRKKIKDGMLAYMEEMDKPYRERVVIEIVDFNFGMRNTNPMENIYFYSKAAPDVGKHMSPEKITYLLPKYFEEQVIRIFLKHSDTNPDGDRKKCENLRKAFKQWYKEEQRKGFQKSAS